MRKNATSARAFLVIGISGLWGVLLDLDHPLCLVARGLPITLENLPTKACRFAHLPMLLVGGFLCLACLACTLGLLACRLERDYRHAQRISRRNSGRLAGRSRSA